MGSVKIKKILLDLLLMVWVLVIVIRWRLVYMDGKINMELLGILIKKIIGILLRV